MHNCIKAGGKVTTESRKTTTFTGIDLNIPANVYVSQGLPQEIKITAKEGVLRQIETMVVDGVLEIEYDTCVSNPDSIKIYITIQTIHKLRINGSGDISTLYGITADDLVLEINGSGDIKVEANATKITNKINGSGDIKLSGSSETLQIVINGSGDIDALDAPTENCIIKINGSGDCRVSRERRRWNQTRAAPLRSCRRPRRLPYLWHRSCTWRSVWSSSGRTPGP